MDVIAVVTGASRGAGKGIAIALGETGATVYVTGRSIADGDSPYGGTVTETADLIARAGGKGVAIALDHTDDEAVAALFARVEAEHGRLDILVNNAANAAASTTMPGGFWEKPLAAVDLITVGLRSHFVSAYHAAPLLIANGRSLIAHRPLRRCCLLPRPRLWCAEGWRGQDGSRFCEGVATTQHRGSFDLDGRPRYRTCARLSCQHAR